MSTVEALHPKRPLLEDLAIKGYIRLPFSLGVLEVERLRDIFAAKSEEGQSKTGQILRALGAMPAFFDAIEQILGDKAVITRSQCFPKAAEQNCAFDWHQGVTITTKTTPFLPAGFGPAKLIQGQQSQISVPAQFLEGLLFARLHLDTVDQADGALEIIPGSHQRGHLSSINMAVEVHSDVAAYVPALSGEIHLFRPLTIHRAGKVQEDKDYRVIQLEFAPHGNLPEPLQWHESVALFE